MKSDSKGDELAGALTTLQELVRAVSAQGDHITQIQREEVERGQISWWFLSFGDERGFRGACFVRAFGILDAVDQVRMLDIHPGGNIAFGEVSVDVDIPEGARKRLLTKDDLVMYFGEVAIEMKRI
jgi:hypothetical protein